MKKLIPIRSSNNRFYKQFLDVFSNIPPINKLMPSDKNVLAEIMHQNQVYQELSDDIRYSVIFSTDTRKIMRDRLGIKAEVFNNILSRLRKHNIIIGKKLNPFFDSIQYKNGFELTFKFVELKSNI